jgi:hypothetical protein
VPSERSKRGDLGTAKRERWNDILVVIDMLFRKLGVGNEIVLFFSFSMKCWLNVESMDVLVDF